MTGVLTAETQGLKAFQLRCKNDSQAWIVADIMGGSHIVVMYGESGSGKSLLAWIIGKAISSGKPLFGKYAVTKGRVLIVDEETPASDLLQRIEAIFGWENENIDFWPRPEWGFRFSDPQWWAGLKAKVQEFKPLLIIWDNLNALQGSWDFEGSNTDVSKLRSRIAELRDMNSEITNLIIHHEGMTKGKPRGSTAIKDMGDTVLHLARLWNTPFRFAVEPEPRKRPAVKPFVVELQVNKHSGLQSQTMKLAYLGEVETIAQPTPNDITVFECFYASRADGTEAQEYTIQTLDVARHKELGINAIRESVNTLTKNGMIERKKGKSNLGKYRLPSAVADTPYTTALLSALTDMYPDAQPLDRLFPGVAGTESEVGAPH